MTYFRPQSVSVTAHMRASCFRSPGLGTTAVQPVMILWNGPTSFKKCTMLMAKIDVYMSAGRAVTVPPAMVRVHRVVVAPTGNNRAVLAKLELDSNGVSDNGIVVNGDATSDGTYPASQRLAVTIPGNLSGLLTQEFTPRHLNATATGYELFDSDEFLEGHGVVIRPGEGLVVVIDPQGSTTASPNTQHYSATLEWEETVA
jgi:hypothetical protein